MPTAEKTPNPPKKATTRTVGKVIISSKNASETETETETAPTIKTSQVPPKLKVEEDGAQPPLVNTIPSTLKYTPDWKVWGNRPVITLSHAISLVHNIHTNSATLDRLKTKKDERTKKFNVDLNTLKSGLQFEASLPVVKPVIGKITNDTEIFLADFVEWIRTKNPFDHLSIPAAFFDLRPPRPGKNLLVDSTTNSNATPTVAVKTRVASNESEFVGKEKKTVARILLALAVKHYGYRPRAATQEAVFAPIATLCQNLSLNGLKDWETVKRVLAHATSALDENEIDGLLVALESAKTPNATAS